MVKSIFFEILTSLLMRLNLSQLSKLGRFIGVLIWYFVPSRRKMAVKSIMLHLKKDKKEARSLAYRNFLNTGRSFIEIFYNKWVDFRFLDQFVEIENKDILEKIRYVNRPVVAVTAHMGAWELLSGIMAVLFYDKKHTQIVVREPDDIVIRDIIIRLRGKYVNEILPRDDSAPKIASCLKKSGICAFLVDHNCGRRKAVFLPFLGEIAAVNFGPALMAIRTRALVLPIFLVRVGDLQYKMYVHEPLDTKTLNGDLKSKIRYVCNFYTKSVEKMVYKYPDQWYWIHNRWRTKPK